MALAHVWQKKCGQARARTRGFLSSKGQPPGRTGEELLRGWRELMVRNSQQVDGEVRNFRNAGTCGSFIDDELRQRGWEMSSMTRRAERASRVIQIVRDLPPYFCLKFVSPEI